MSQFTDLLYSRGYGEILEADSGPKGEPCPKCNDIGIYAGAEWNIVHVCDCDAGRNYANLQAQKRSQAMQNIIPREYADLDFSTFGEECDRREIWEGKRLAFWAAFYFVEVRGEAFSLADVVRAFGLDYVPRDVSSRRGLMIYGANGTGKTGLAISVYKALVGAGVAAAYTRLQDLFADIQGSYGDVGKDTSEITRRYEFAPVLVIDEFKASNVTPNKKDIVEQIIRRRQDNGLPTFATGNLDPKGFGSLWGSWIATRVREWHWLRLEGEPMRREIIAPEDAF